jgi:cardiolipin synthase
LEISVSESEWTAEQGSYIPRPASASYPARSGNLVRALIDSGPAFRRICEAIEVAQRSVWVTITFMSPSFQMPDSRGTLLDVLDRAARRGLDVRILFWRPNLESSNYGQTFSGSPADRAMLSVRNARFRARWDRAHGAHCQHQKAWVIDAGEYSETAFVGGINPTFPITEPGHSGDDQRHDIFVEIAGPCATDVHHNFAQRWNEASERTADDGVWGHTGDDDLRFPSHVSGPRGLSLVQIQRNVSANCYKDGYQTPGGSRYTIADGENSIVEQYRLAIDAARRTIYIENQALPIPEIAIKLQAALKRGIDVILLVPADPEQHVRNARWSATRRDFFDPIEALGEYDNFTLMGIAGKNPLGGRGAVYVHSKIMLIDDVWATIGSCNLHGYSLFGNTEMNASIWDGSVVRALRCALLGEHMDYNTTALNDRAAHGLCRQLAVKNRLRLDTGDGNWQGFVFRIDPAAYGK